MNHLFVSFLRSKFFLLLVALHTLGYAQGQPQLLSCTSVLQIPWLAHSQVVSIPSVILGRMYKFFAFPKMLPLDMQFLNGASFHHQQSTLTVVSNSGI